MTHSSEKILRRLAAVAGLTSVLVAITSFLLIEHRPDWYAPPTLDEIGIQSARRNATISADRFGDLLVRGKPFEWILEGDAINVWLAALPHIWPEAARGIPQAWSRMAVSFRDGQLRLGGLYDASGWRTVVNVTGTIDVDDDRSSLVIRLVDARLGAMPLPRWMLRRFVDPLPASRAFRSDDGAIRSIGELFRGVRIRNRFVWPNGKRPFLITAIDANDGRIRLQIEPL